MTGHGGPPSFVIAGAHVALALVACAMVPRTAAGQAAAPPVEPLHLQITWGGGDSVAWAGQVTLDQGTLSDLQLIGPNADAAGSVWLEPTGVRVRSLSAQKTDGMEVVATAPSDAKLLLELAPNSQTQPTHVQVPLTELARRPFQMRLDDHGNTLEVHLLPNPPIRLAFNDSTRGHANLIFERGDQLTFEIEPVLPASLHGTTLDVETTLTPVRLKEAVWSDTKKLAVPVDSPARTDVAVPLQVMEGVYTVRVVVARPSGYLRDKFFPGASAPVAERSFQVVVLDTQTPASNEAGKWDQVLEIDPTNPRWVEKLPAWTQLRRIPGISNLSHGALGSVRAGAVDLPLGRFIELPAAVGIADPHWQSYSLPLQGTGIPHLLEIEYPADKDQYLGVSIVEPGSNGVIQGNPRDAGFFVEGLGRSEVKQRDSYRLLFWPRTQSPLLVITNQHPTFPAHFGKIRVYRRSGPLNEGPRQATASTRLVAAYVSKPLASESLGVMEAAESADGNRAFSGSGDSRSAYETAIRFKDYVQYAGYNSAVVSFVSGGRASYPNSQLLPKAHIAAGRSSDQLEQADPLELLLRIFDREHLTLVPAVEFAAPISQLEELRRSTDPQSSGLELIGPDGRTWLESIGGRNGLAPYYNMLDPHVQRAMLALVSEIEQRYGAHPSFGGIAVQLSSNGYSQLPPLEWSLDDATVERFTRDTGIALARPGTDRFAARQAALTGPHAPAWRTWRAQQVAAFYQQMAAIVSNNSRHHLLLTTERLFEHPVVRERIRPNLLTDNRVLPAMLDLGIDRAMLDRIPGIILCSTNFIEPGAPLPDRAVDLEVNAAFAALASAKTGDLRSATILFHPELSFRLASFNAVSPFRVSGEMSVHSRTAPGGQAVRLPYVQSLLQGDPQVVLEGSELPLLGHDDVLRSVRRIVSAVPVGAQVMAVDKQPVMVRTYSAPNATTILMVNSSPWRIASQVTLDVSQPTMIEPVSSSEDKSNESAKSFPLRAGRQAWPIALEPYDIQMFRVAAGTAVADVAGTWEPNAATELKTLLDDLASRDLSAPHAYRALANPSFEPVGGNAQLAGWHLVGNTKSSAISLDATAPQDGKTCLYFRNAGASAAVESDAFPIPATGQLSLTVFARGQNIGPATELRLIIEAESKGQLFQRAARVAAAQAQHPAQQWGRPFAILVNDLPLDSHGQMKVKFELTGPGELWLDNVKLNDLLFPQAKVYEHSQAEIIRLLQRIHEVQTAYDEGQLRECMQLLDGYWPRFVMAYTPPATPAIALGAAPEQKTTTPANPPSPESAEPPATGFQDRLKRMVPILR